MKRSSAAVLDDAVYLNIARDKEDDERIARQTIRIKAPVTSELLQNKLNHLKTSTTDNSQHKREVCFKSNLFIYLFIFLISKILIMLTHKPKYLFNLIKSFSAYAI